VGRVGVLLVVDGPTGANVSELGSFLRRLGRGDRLEAVSDAELVRHFLTHQDAEAFEALVRRHGPLVLRVCHRELPRPADAEDAFQATFLVLAQKAGRIRDLETLPAWLAGVARRLARRLGQQLRSRREKLLALQPKVTSSAAIGPSWWDEERRHLPEEYQTVIDLCLIQGLTRDEAARVLGQSPSAVHGLLYRARLKLKKQLVEHGAVAGSLAIGAQASGAVIDRLAPILAQAAVRLVRDGKLADGVVSAQALLLAQRGTGRGWLATLVVAGGLAVGVTAWAGWKLSGPRGEVAGPIVVPTATEPPTVAASMPDKQEEREVQRRGGQGQPAPVQQQSGVPTQTMDVNPDRQSVLPEQQVKGQTTGRQGASVPQPPAPNQPQQQAGSGRQNAFNIPVPPADRVPTMSERVNLAKNLVASSGSLQGGMVPLLPNVERTKLDGKDVLISVITSEKEYRDCTAKAPPVQVPPGTSTASDPAWDGGLFQLDWTKDVLVVVVVMEQANSVTLTPLSECWIAPDKGGVGHLLLTYAGPEPMGKMPWLSFPYVMAKLPRENLKRVAVTIWRPTGKPAGAAVVPAK
jgi:DNA-directed RNA polymerase specialized sigma24 family protein